MKPASTQHERVMTDTTMTSEEKALQLQKLFNLTGITFALVAMLDEHAAEAIAAGDVHKQIAYQKQIIAGMRELISAVHVHRHSIRCRDLHGVNWFDVKDSMINAIGESDG